MDNIQQNIIIETEIFASPWNCRRCGVQMSVGILAVKYHDKKDQLHQKLMKYQVELLFVNKLTL